MEEWIKCPLGDILNFRRGHDLPKTSMIPGDIPVAGSNGIIGFHNVSTPISPCITIGRSGNVGTPYIYDKCWAHNTVLYIDDYKGNDPKYLYYILKTLPLASFGGGSAVPTLNRNHIHPLEVDFCRDIELQKKIAGILSKIDDKIEINNQINDNLEQQAQALYKSWFVDFEPFKDGDFVESELGSIPKGWKVVELGDVTKQITEKVKNRTDVKVLSPVTTGELVLSEEYFTKQVFSESIAKYIVVKPLQFAYNPARVNIGSLGMNTFEFDGCVSPVYVVFECERDYQYFFDYFRKTEAFKEEVLARAIGGVRQSLSYKDFSLIKLIYPPRTIVEKFNRLYSNILVSINHNKVEANNLTDMRDILLPKLMSGELKINEIDC